MIEDAYISYETAKLLQSLPAQCRIEATYHKVYHITTKKLVNVRNVPTRFVRCYIPAYTQQVVQRWLREKYDIQVVVLTRRGVRVEGKPVWYYDLTSIMDPRKTECICGKFKTCEEAMEGGIMYAVTYHVK